LFDRARDKFQIHKRFPELERAKNELTGEIKLPQSPLKNIHAQEIIKFSEIVYNLSKEHDPSPAR
jgi:hypothetical protein